jgi:hypothetical protein
MLSRCFVQCFLCIQTIGASAANPNTDLKKTIVGESNNVRSPFVQRNDEPHSMLKMSNAIIDFMFIQPEMIPEILVVRPFL